ncbi:MAG TPA: LOG family protein [Burkholderiaceae bacterium]
MWSWRHLGYHQRPIGLLDVAGYFQPLLSMVRQAERGGFVTPEQLGMVTLHESPEALLDEVAALAARGASTDDLRRI